MSSQLKNIMKKRPFLYLILFILVIKYSYASVPDSDFDGVPDVDSNDNTLDKCPNSLTHVVDQFGCSCEQKNCPSDNNECTDDCGVINGLTTCNVKISNKPCQGGYCSNGICTTNQNIDVTKPVTIDVGTTAGQDENQGLQSTIVIVAGIGNTPPPIDIETAKKMIFDNSFGTVNDFYSKNSFGKAYLTGKVVGPYTLPARIYSGWDDILNEAVKAADADVYFPDYSRVILIFPPQSFSGFRGRSTIGKITVSTSDGDIKASVSWISVVIPYVLIHELGHGFGMLHANILLCPNCITSFFGYDDPFDVMGGNRKFIRHLNAPHKEEVGWLSDNTVITTEGEYLLKPIELPQPKGYIQQIKLPLKTFPKTYLDDPSTPAIDNADNVFYTLEFRQPVDYDYGAVDALYKGIVIHLSAYPGVNPIKFTVS